MTQAVVSRDNAARVQDNANLIWGAAEKMRGKITPADYGKVILPFTVLRRMDCLLAPHIQTIKVEAARLAGATDEARDQILFRKTKMGFYGASDFTLEALLADPENIADNLKAYINGLSKNMRDVFIEHFGFFGWIDRLDKQNLLYALVKFFADKDLSPKAVSTLAMGYLFENLIRRFNEASNATAGDHYTPREVIRLMTSLLFAKDGEKLASEASVISILDPACGTGGMLAVADEYLKERNKDLLINLHGQEVNPESFAICRSDMLITGHSPDNIRLGNTLTQDRFAGQTFSYCLSNPPYGVDYSEEYDTIKAEHERGDKARFGPGIPRKSDGQLLFLLHMISKLPTDRGGRIAVIMNGSPLFNGAAGSGESEIRRALMERDMVDAIIALPTDLFYNTGIATYIWIVTNRKDAEDRGKVRLIDATARCAPMRKSLGSKRRELTDANISDIVNLYLDHECDQTVKVFAPSDFGFRKVFIERPLRLDVDLSESESSRFRNASALDEYCLWMQQQFGVDIAERLMKVAGEVTAHVEDQEGLSLLRATEGAARVDVATTEKACRRILSSLLDAEMWAERRALTDLLRSLRTAGKQSEWTNYNVFLEALERHTKARGERLTAGRIKVIRAWVTATNPKAAPVIDKAVARTDERNEKYGVFKVEGQRVSFERDTDLGDTERVPLNEGIEAYFDREVRPHLPDAWINADKRDTRDGQIGIVGYEINFNRYFYRYVPPRKLEEIDADLKQVEAEIAALLGEVTE